MSKQDVERVLETLGAVVVASSGTPEAPQVSPPIFSSDDGAHVSHALRDIAQLSQQLQTKRHRPAANATFSSNKARSRATTLS